MNKSEVNQSDVSRRSFLRKTTAAGAVGTTAALLGTQPIFGQSATKLTPGDVAILTFLAAAELVEDDLWTQYTELAMNNPKFNRALSKINKSLPQWIMNDRNDERSHANFINAYLQANGAQSLNLDAFRTLPPSTAVGAQGMGRLTNLKSLTVDTSWFNRYRSTQNADLGGNSFPQFVNIVNEPAIPLTDTEDENTIQAIANVAAYHFCAIEQGGGSLYNALSTKVQSPEVLSILSSIGPTEVYHFGVFHTTLEHLPGLVTESGMVFPDLADNVTLARQDFPGPASFLATSFPICSTIRPRSIPEAGAVAAATGLVNSGLFAGQSAAFLNAVVALATAADNATRM